MLAELLALNRGLFPVDAIHARSMSALALDAIREVNTLLRDATVLLVGESDTFPVAHGRALVNATVTRIAGRPGTLPSEYRQLIETLASGPEGPGLPWLLLEALDRRDVGKRNRRNGPLDALHRPNRICTALVVRRTVPRALVREGEQGRVVGR